jgi:hypothetical protein
MSFIKNIFGIIGSLFSSIFGIIPKLLSKKSAKAKGSSATAKGRAKAATKGSGFYLEADEARSDGTTSTSPTATAKTSKKAAAAPAAVAAAPAAAVQDTAAVIANALNMPKPTVSFSEVPFNQFAPRRRPGKNMKSFMDMAKTMKKPI